MTELNFAVVVASVRPRTGKTLLARALADYFIASGAGVELFDADAAAAKLSGYFPERTTVVDLNKVADQMMLFDRLAMPSTQVRVVDLAAHGFRPFFDLMRETDYVVEARGRRIETTIFYIPERDIDSYEQGQRLRERFPDCAFVLAENEVVGDIDRYARINDAYWALKKHDLRMLIPRLDPLFSLALEDTKLPLAEFIHAPPAQRSAAHLSFAFLSPHARSGIQRWTRTMFGELDRVMRHVAARVPAPVAEETVAESKVSG
jgi:hypothetical protein